jgi:CMP/dCMP kinase
VARRLKIAYLDTGAMYRAVTYEALRRGVDLHRDEDLEELVKGLTITVATSPSGETLTMIDGRDVTPFIRSPEINSNVSYVAESAPVRRELVKIQQRLGEEGGIVMDGRDIGTRVLPHAPHKFFLTASLPERARRRYLELKDKDPRVSREEVEKDIARRDRIDSSRTVDPLKAAPDSILVDTTELSAVQVIDLIVAQISRQSRD